MKYSKIDSNNKCKIYHDYIKLQQYRCAICGLHQDASEKRFCIDHDHYSGEVRGVLCFKCNWGLGMFHDSADLLMQAAKYLGR